MDDLLRNANRMALVSRWADDIAHEIKNPLHAMVINLELVKRRAAAGQAEPAIQRADIVEAEVHRVHGLIDALLKLVRPWPETGSTDLDSIFDHLRPVLDARARVRKLQFHHSPGAGRVAIPPEHMAQIVLHLLDMAIDHAPADGRVESDCHADHGSVTLRVRPIAPAAADPGGPGLAIVTDLVQHAGGTLAIEPAKGRQGRVAIVTLPRAGAA